MTHDEFEELIKRQAIVFAPLDKKPADDHSSWMGKVTVARLGETWPEWNSKPMMPVCQLDLTQLELVPANLDDIALLTLFVAENDLPDGDQNGYRWLLRAYQDIDGLIPLTPPDAEFPIKPVALVPEEPADDFPCWEDVAVDVPEELDEEYYDLFENLDGIKIGGWPTLIQGEIYWPQPEAQPQYVLQIDSLEESEWSWGDGGVAYIGRGTPAFARDVWVFDWQCM